jgi:hypothetical protein
MWAYCADGAVVQVRDALPPTAGTFDEPVELTEGNAGGFGWLPVVASDAPSPDHVAELEVDGDRVVQMWRLDSEARAARLLAVARSQREQRLAGAVATLRDWALTTTAQNAPERFRVLCDRLADLIETRA